jgi:hypothetical protein
LRYDIDHVAVANPHRAPDLAKKNVTGKHHLGAFRQCGEEIELDPCEIHLDAIELDLARRQINLEIAEHAPGIRLGVAEPLSGAAQHRVDAGDELAAAERLTHIVIGPDRQTDEPVHFVISGGQHHHIGITEHPETATDLYAVDPRKAEVEHHHSRVIGFRPLQTGFTIFGQRD